MPETEVVADLWQTSRGEIDLAQVVAKHGFYGPSEGEPLEVLSVEVEQVRIGEPPGPVARAARGTSAPAQL